MTSIAPFRSPISRTPLLTAALPAIAPRYPDRFQQQPAPRQQRPIGASPLADAFRPTVSYIDQLARGRVYPELMPTEPTRIGFGDVVGEQGHTTATFGNITLKRGMAPSSVAATLGHELMHVKAGVWGRFHENLREVYFKDGADERALELCDDAYRYHFEQEQRSGRPLSRAELWSASHTPRVVVFDPVHGPEVHSKIARSGIVVDTVHRFPEASSIRYAFTERR